MRFTNKRMCITLTLCVVVALSSAFSEQSAPVEALTCSGHTSISYTYTYVSLGANYQILYTPNPIIGLGASVEFDSLNFNSGGDTLNYAFDIYNSSTLVFEIFYTRSSYPGYAYWIVSYC